MNELQAKHDELKAIFAEMGSVLVAYSGGVDSALVLKVAHDVLGERAAGTLATSPTLPDQEAVEAVAVAEGFGARVIVTFIDELASADFAANRGDRCYYCKSMLFGELETLAEQEGFAWIADGFNADDVGDYRPGLQAGAERGVRSPLKEAGLGKAEIRALSRELDLPTWDKPAMACLSSRVPYGTTITREILQQIAAAEVSLRGMGFRQFRVRHHGDIARIEVERQSFARFLEPEVNAAITARFREIGFTYITLDLEGFRSGSMNRALPGEARRAS